MPTRLELSTKKNVYSWSAKVDFVIGHGGGFHDLDDLATSLLWQNDYILRLEPRRIHPVQEAAGISGYRFVIEAEDSASGAESLGTRLAFGLLSLAVEQRWGLSLSWPDSPSPCRVIDRLKSVGVGGEGFATVTRYMYVSDFVDKLETGFARYSHVPDRLLLSMELFASSMLEVSSRSKLVILVSALEALATQENLEQELGDMVATLIKVVEESAFDDESLKSSICGQVLNLKRESARRAIRRLLLENGMTLDDVSFVEEAYGARSKIVHEGKRVSELDAMVAKLENMLIRVYRNL